MILPNHRLEAVLKNAPAELKQHYRSLLEESPEEEEAPEFYTIDELKVQYDSEPEPKVNSTGWKELDRIAAGGIAEGEVALLAGQSGIGKTHFAVNLALNYADRGQRVFYVTLEDGWKMVYRRVQDMDTNKNAGDHIFMMHEDKFTLQNATSILKRGIEDADLIILDNLFSLPLKQGKNGDFWNAQAEWVDTVCNLIRSTRSSALILHHLNKTPNGSQVERYQIAGSTRLVNRVAQAWLLFHSDKYPEVENIMGIKVEKLRRAMKKGESFLKSDRTGRLHGMLETEVLPEMRRFVQEEFKVEL
jgi:predicted ATP-dependent serine protease